MRRIIPLSAFPPARLLGLFLLFAAGPAYAQDPRLSRLDSATALQVRLGADSARAEGLPAEPLIQKALEGNVIGAESERIVSAVRILRGQLAQAREALGSQADAAELVAGDHDFLRVDFYEIGGRPKFGEFCLFPGSGLDPFDPASLDDLLGGLWAAQHPRRILSPAAQSPAPGILGLPQ